MFPFDRIGVVHLIRIVTEVSLILFLFIFGTCRCGTLLGFNDTNSLCFLITIIIMASTDIYHVLLALFTLETLQRDTLFHMIFYSIMSLLALLCCFFSIVSYTYCTQHHFNILCSHYSCRVLWISISLTFMLTFMYSASVKLICCLRDRNMG
ncbi:unnamed protein product [Rotaria magnacalcarata]|nr:unnamed protein product [Rotaria magnacalcarata]CAF1571964.1 unnamed protein product [Rotaria magnacalcarata]CAF1989970.1 unnamed protein product [Rotaria magnacalcarata]CAF2113201.1 unnamed protein product [Rotaria magnacalcarata]CAF2118873.1 unnamed protein product [Rotaria magnacalcarata]